MPRAPDPTVQEYRFVVGTPGRTIRVWARDEHEARQTVTRDHGHRNERIRLAFSPR